MYLLAELVCRAKLDVFYSSSMSDSYLWQRDIRARRLRSAGSWRRLHPYSWCAAFAKAASLLPILQGRQQPWTWSGGLFIFFNHLLILIFVSLPWQMLFP